MNSTDLKVLAIAKKFFPKAIFKRAIDLDSGVNSILLSDKVSILLTDGSYGVSKELINGNLFFEFSLSKRAIIKKIKFLYKLKSN